ncbi:MAG: hypothetical protein ISN26_05425 [Betaproteobacteria bacterium AqS2]|uniref:Haloacid dehalogenase n=1 Tax=Candidatus Amphirhobacter heronislandensis TaxID=1732024 RepID=A0A930UI36_9GAMM|nr:hypothetical protein [Betaproteobacteria bacterium AqS2]
MAAAAKPVILALDLDGTLHQGDLAQLGAAALLRRNPLRAASLAWWLLRGGRLLLKNRLAATQPLDMATLEWNAELIAYAKSRDDCVLVLASGAAAAEAKRAAAHLAEAHGLEFAEILAASAEVNLIGVRKAEALRALARARETEYEYAGDSPRQDPPVFAGAKVSHFVNPSPEMLQEHGSAASRVFTTPPPPGGPWRRLLGMLQAKG